MTKLAVIYGSSRPSNVGETVANWFVGEVGAGDGVEIELVDLAELNLPLINEAMPPMMGQYENQSTKDWAEKVSGYDAFVFVPAEYNRSFTPILKNALDTLYAEWNDKPAAFVSYSSGPSSNAVVALGPVMEALKIQAIEPNIHVSKIYEAIDEDGNLKPENISGADPQAIIDALT